MHPRIDVGLGVGTVPPSRRAHAVARLAKLIGVTSIWVVDHFTGFFPKSVWDGRFTWLARGRGSPDAFFEWQVMAGHLASRAGRMQVGVGVTEAIRRHPAVLAQAALTLSHMTKRPPILGLGAGEAENVIPYGLSFERPVARLEEALEVIRMCLDETSPLEYQGRFFRLHRAGLDLKPGRAGLPQVWVGAHGPRMLRLTGRLGDGWLPAVPMSPQDYAESLRVIRESAAGAGRDPGAIVPAMSIPYVVGRDAADVDRQLRHPAVRFVALLAPDATWQEAGYTHPFGTGFRGMVDFVPSRYDRSEVEAAIAKVPSDLLGRRLVAGTADQVVAQIWQLVDAGLRHAVLSPISPVVSRRALVHTVKTLPRIVRSLRTGER